MSASNGIHCANNNPDIPMMHVEGVPGFRQTLIDWGRNNFRAFPWRKTDDPYRILMAELMLHRTQASQVSRIYEHFVATYPDIQALTGATLTELRNMLYPLGLRWRIDLLHDMARVIMERFGGEIPREKSSLLSLPGVSDYIACSVRCFAWNMAEPLIDTNTVRVVGRLFNLQIKDSSRRNPRFRELITLLVDPIEPRLYNFALLDLADLICRKRDLPKCGQCPVVVFCLHENKRNETNLEEAVTIQ
jgi:A/G-specific adenine glycosylase